VPEVHAEVDAVKHDLRDHDDREPVQQSLITRLSREVELRDVDLAALRERRRFSGCATRCGEGR
jgi:hypothetical protein